VVWPSWRNSPPDLPGLSNDVLRTRIDRHLDEVVTAMKGKVDVWDVVNEPFDNHDVFDRLGDPVGLMAGWFRRVKAIDPKPTLVLNDYPPLDGTLKDNAHLESFYRYLAALKATGAPLEGIGFQGHIGGNPIPPEAMLAGLDRFGRLGLPIEITELDVNMQDRPLQARYLRDFLIAAFSHPRVSGITQWGFWANRHWLPDGALFGPDWSLRPHGKAYLDLVRKTWWTDSAGRTGADGTYRTRGFYGDYDVTANGQRVRVKLAPGAKPITIRLRKS
jgi:GH35 family endo-1,4-beta-xylanase